MTMGASWPTIHSLPRERRASFHPTLSQRTDPMPFITAKDGAELYWREWGEGAPILFLSSLGCDSRMWEYQIAAFADEGFRCIGFDRRGHGRSDQPARGYDFDTFADDVAALVENLNLTDLTLISHSMAGGEAVRYLTRHGTNASRASSSSRRRRRCCSRRMTTQTACR
jgi:pimeloyl-ACP methyl ester carboxylesterase